MGIRAWYRELREPIFQRIEVRESPLDSAYQVERLLDTSVGSITVDLGPSVTRVTRFAPDGSAAARA